MKTLLTTLLIVLSTAANATVVTGLGEIDGTIKTRGYETDQTCHEVLTELEIKNNPEFYIIYGESIWNENTSWFAQYTWNGNVWSWICHGDPK